MQYNVEAIKGTRWMYKKTPKSDCQISIHFFYLSKTLEIAESDSTSEINEQSSSSS